MVENSSARVRVSWRVERCADIEVDFKLAFDLVCGSHHSVAAMALP